MNNDELLEKIGNLIDQKIEPLKQGQAQTNKRLDTMDKRLDGLEQGQARLEQGQAQTNKKLGELTVDMADFFHKTWEKMDETDERVTIIEDHLGLANPVKKN